MMNIVWTRGSVLANITSFIFIHSYFTNEKLLENNFFVGVIAQKFKKFESTWNRKNWQVQLSIIRLLVACRGKY